MDIQAAQTILKYQLISRYLIIVVKLKAWEIYDTTYEIQKEKSQLIAERNEIDRQLEVIQSGGIIG